MKTTRTLKKAWMAALIGTLSISQALAAAGTEGHGGFVIVDGVKYELADLHFKPKVFDQFSYDEPLLTELKRIEGLLTLRGINASSFFEKDIYSPLVSYRFVSRLPQECAGELSPVDPIYQVEQFGCTTGKITWLLPRIFNSLSLEQKVGAILHERLHSFAPNEPHDVISPFVHGVVLLHRLANDSEHKMVMNPEETTYLAALGYSGTQLGFPILPKLGPATCGSGPEFRQSIDTLLATRIHPRGGGFIFGNSEIPAETYLDYNSAILDSKINATSAILGSCVRNSKVSGVSQLSKSSVVDSELSQIDLVDSSMIRNTNLVRATEVARSELAQVFSDVSGESSSSQPTLIRDSRIVAVDPTHGRIELGSGSKIEKTQISATVAKVRENVSLSGAFIGSDRVSLPPGLVVSDSALSGGDGELMIDTGTTVINHSRVGSKTGLHLGQNTRLDGAKIGDFVNVRIGSDVSLKDIEIAGSMYHEFSVGILNGTKFADSALFLDNDDLCTSADSPQPDRLQISGDLTSAPGKYTVRFYSFVTNFSPCRGGRTTTIDSAKELKRFRN